MQADLTTNLGSREEGQRFRLIEPASTPVRPSGPNRLRLALGGAAGGLVLGLVLAFLRSSFDKTFLSEKEVAQAFRVPLVLGVPEILTPKEQTGRTWKKVFEWAAAAALIVLVISTEVYIYIRG
jgi:ABC-type arginine transport system permease subunit